MLLGASLTILAAGCADDVSSEAVESQETTTRVGAASSGCYGPTDCASDQYCQRSDCLSAGTCQPKPASGTCDEDDPVVCGCDGINYESACHARRAGTSPASQGTCPTRQPCAGCPQDPEKCTAECGSGKVCSDASQGVCVGKPGCCADGNMDPVCGCDGDWYVNRCHASNNGITAPAGSGASCANNSKPFASCTIGDGECGKQTFCASCGDHIETCLPKPKSCNLCGDPEPVCGCNGQQYPSKCAAWAAGQAVANNDDCFTDQPDCPTCQSQGKVYTKCCSQTGGRCITPPPPRLCSYYPDRPVCGCDGKWYTNRCDAFAHGVAPAPDDSRCPDKTGCPCDNDQVRHRCDEGVCLEKPKDCPTEIDPVCGCNGKTYDNACKARLDGAPPAYEGPCFCGGEVRCEYPEQVCNTCEPGSCLPRPSDEKCRQLEQEENPPPVCGCDGNTYDNWCRARQAGVANYEEGPCECDDGTQCDYPSTVCNTCGEGCLAPPEGTCPDESNPVCGCDGVTYRNKCVALKNGVEPVSDEPCQCEVQQ